MTGTRIFTETVFRERDIIEWCDEAEESVNSGCFRDGYDEAFSDGYLAAIRDLRDDAKMESIRLFLKERGEK